MCWFWLTAPHLVDFMHMKSGVKWEVCFWLLLLHFVNSSPQSFDNRRTWEALSEGGCDTFLSNIYCISHLQALTQLGQSVNVKFDKPEFPLMFFSQFLQFRSQHLTRFAPISWALDYNRHFGLHDFRGPLIISPQLVFKRIFFQLLVEIFNSCFCFFVALLCIGRRCWWTCRELSEWVMIH